MRIKRKLAAALAIFFIAVNGFPAFSMIEDEASPQKAVLKEVESPMKGAGEETKEPDRETKTETEESAGEDESEAQESAGEDESETQESAGEDETEAGESAGEDETEAGESAGEGEAETEESAGEDEAETEESAGEDETEESTEEDESEDLESKAEDESEPQDPTIEEESKPQEQTKEEESTEDLLPEEMLMLTLEENAVSDEAPLFYMELIEEGDSPGLYGTLSHIPEDTISIQPMYFDVSDGAYWEITGREWEILSDEVSYGGEPVTQLCAGLEDTPVCDYIDEQEDVDRILVLMEIGRANGEFYRTEPALITRNVPSAVPETEPPFTVHIKAVGQGFNLHGTFLDFLPDILCIRPMYSYTQEEGSYEYFTISGGDYLYWNLSRLSSNVDEFPERSKTQMCGYGMREPLKGYLDGEVEKLFVKLEITLENGTVYYTQDAVLDRSVPQPQPEATTAVMVFSPTMLSGSSPGYGKYQVTVRESITAGELKALLPETLPIEIQLIQNTGGIYATGIVERQVEWKIPDGLSLTSEEDAVVLENAARISPLSAGDSIQTSNGAYILNDSPKFDTQWCTGEIKLVLNIIADDASPDIVLTDQIMPDRLSLAFFLKPSGASKITAYSLVNRDEAWKEIGDLLLQKDVDATQSQPSFGYVDILSQDETPYADYLADDIEGFFIGIKIEGGVYHGKMAIFPWPGDYQIPPRIPEVGGSGGNNGNVGSGNNSGGSTDRGQRPGISAGPSMDLIPPLTQEPPVQATDSFTERPSVNPPQQEQVVFAEPMPANEGVPSRQEAAAETTADTFETEILISAEEPEITIPEGNKENKTLENLPEDVPQTEQAAVSSKGKKAPFLPRTAAAVLVLAGGSVAAFAGLSFNKK